MKTTQDMDCMDNMDKNQEHVWGFDVGKGSLGEAVRIGSEVKHLESLLIDPDFAEIKTAAESRRQMRTRIAHKEREKWLEKCLKEAGIEVLQRRSVDIVDGKWQLVAKADIRLEKEFPSDGENICYNSIALRCKLLLGHKLESWQIFKALNSAIQNRGYEAVAWMSNESNSNNDEDDNYQKKLNLYEKEKTELLEDLENPSEFDFPCFFKAYKMGLWSPKNPYNVELRIDNCAQKAKDYVVPRKYVEAEFVRLVEQASLQYPKLKQKAAFILYGISETAYASYNPQLRRKFNLKRGAESDWTALGQKIPRFDNRIIDKCKLIPRLNVCKIKALDKIRNENDLLYYEITLALKLLNLRFFRNGNIESLNFKEFLKAFEIAKVDNYRLTKTALKKFYKQIQASLIDENQSEVEAPKSSGRASFSRPAMHLLKELIFSAKSPAEFYETKKSEIKNTDSNKGLVVSDLDFIKLMKDAPWNGIFIPDVDTFNYSKIVDSDSESKIHKLIGSQKDPIVRHRLSFFYDRIKALSKKFGTPDKVVLEFVREDFLGKKAKTELNISMKKRFNEKLDIAKKLEESKLKGGKMLLKMELFQKQGGICLYTGDPLEMSDLASLEIEHIVPRSRGGPDSMFNYVLTKESTNKQKANLTPYEWLSKDETKWLSYCDRVKARSKELGAKRSKLLIQNNAEELVEKYTALAETAWIAKLAQRIVCLHFGFQFGGNTGEKRVFTVSGSLTARIRSNYGLNKLLHNTKVDKEKLTMPDYVKLIQDLDKKNRANKKHHALDAMCLCFAPTSKNSKNVRIEQLFPDEIKKDVEGFFRKYIEKIIPNEVASKKPRLEKTIYSKRTIDGKECIVKKINILDLAYKSDGKEKLKFDLVTLRKRVKKNSNKLYPVINPVVRNLISKFLETNPNESDWKNWCENVRIPSKNGNGSKVLRVLVLGGNTEEYKDLSKDACGAYRKGDSHKGQIIWESKNGKNYVAPIYTHSSKNLTMSELKKNPQFNKIVGIFKSHCLVKIDNDVYNDKGEFLLKADIYTLNTIQTNGQAIFTTSNGEKSKPININYLVKAGIRRIRLDY